MYDSTKPNLYTNRAMARMQQGKHQEAILDCLAGSQINEKLSKPYYIMAKCLLALNDPDHAVENATRAYSLGLEGGEHRSLPSLRGLVLKCKKMRWDLQETIRCNQTSQLQAELEGLLMTEKAKALAMCGANVSYMTTAESWEGKIQQLRDTFQRASSANEKERSSPPEWAIDDISFEVMIDPVTVCLP